MTYELLIIVSVPLSNFTMITRELLRLFLLISPLIAIISAYSHGAPTKSCQTLYPGHGVDKQYGQAPYEIRSSLGPNGNVVVTIDAKGGLPFTGFMLQARYVTDRENIVNGKFSEDKNSQTRNCNGDNPLLFERDRDVDRGGGNLQ
ncbi:unnamed protein product [Oppiella nova]|uniref:Reelin domain-containing protein n=1 Tax=Oppiella nova TaxID=334625 RepID=A0A7R9M5C5_9ACAR|nr:unnamed protein product [Oppiella nova]CAG2170789.1 unnamed protein product [Oppiella nova]